MRFPGGTRGTLLSSPREMIARLKMSRIEEKTTEMRGFKELEPSRPLFLPRSGSQTHTVTWKVERWSALPSGFRQGARYRPPGGAPWSLDLYKGGIKRERPGMIALYVHYDAPTERVPRVRRPLCFMLHSSFCVGTPSRASRPSSSVSSTRTAART